MLKNAFFRLKSPFRPEIIKVFVSTFWACRENDLVRKIRLISKFMMSHPDQQRITIHILLNISRIKGNQAVKFVQLIEYPKKNIFL